MDGGEEGAISFPLQQQQHLQLLSGTLPLSATMVTAAVQQQQRQAPDSCSHRYLYLVSILYQLPQLSAPSFCSFSSDATLVRGGEGERERERERIRAGERERPRGGDIDLRRPRPPGESDLRPLSSLLLMLFAHCTLMLPLRKRRPCRSR